MDNQNINNYMPPGNLNKPSMLNGSGEWFYSPAGAVYTSPQASAAPPQSSGVVNMPLGDNTANAADDLSSSPDPLPETVDSPLYTPGFLRTQIGKLMRVEFLVGNMLNDRVGRLMKVGASYILMSTIDDIATLMCDIYSIKFVTIIENLHPNVVLVP